MGNDIELEIKEKVKEIDSLSSEIERLKKEKAAKITILAEENIIKLGKEIAAHRKILSYKENELMAMKDIKHAKGQSKDKSGEFISEPKIVEVLEQLKKLEELRPYNSVIFDKTNNTCSDVCSILDEMVDNVKRTVFEIDTISRKNIDKINKDIPKSIRETILTKNTLLTKRKLTEAEMNLNNLTKIKNILEQKEICSCTH